MTTEEQQRPFPTVFEIRYVSVQGQEMLYAMKDELLAIRQAEQLHSEGCTDIRVIAVRIIRTRDSFK